MDYLWRLGVALCCVQIPNVLCQDGRSDVVSSPTDAIFLPFKTTIGRNFQAQSEVSIRESEKETVVLFVDMFHDIQNLRGRFDLYMNKDVMSYYYDGSIEEVTVVGGKKCTVTKNNEKNFFSKTSFWGWIADPVIIGPGALLFRNTTVTDIKPTEEIVRGIPCEKFTTKDNIDKGVTLTYWFTLAKWRNPTLSNMRVPVRVSAVGQARTAGVDLPVNMIVDFSFFNADVDNHYPYMIPRGIGCDGFETVSPLHRPHLLPQFSFNLEIFDNVKNKDTNQYDVFLYKVWYDGLGKVIKATGSNHGKPYATIQDYNTGVSYNFNELEECSVGPILSSGKEKMMSKVINGMKDPEEILKMNEKYYFVGKTVERGIDCEIWETVLYNSTFEDITMDKMVYTYYFSSDMVESVTSGHAQRHVPIALHITLTPLLFDEKTTMYLKLNYFAFDEPIGENFFDVMDISNCFTEMNDNTLFAISFPGSEQKVKLFKDNHKATHISAQTAILGSAAVSPLRLPFLKVFYEPQNVLVQGRILESPSLMARFNELSDPETPPTRGESPEGPLKSTDDCALRCIQKTAFNCTAFTTCDTDDSVYKECFLTAKTGKADWSKPIKDTDKTCKLFVKAVTNANSLEPSLNVAIKQLQKDASSGKLSIETLTGDGEKISITSNSFDASYRPTGSGSVDFDPVTVDKRLVSSLDSSTVTETNVDVYSARECYDLCVKETSISCASFSYCSHTHQCRLSSVYVSKNNKGEVENATSCTIYTKSALQFFNELPGLFPTIEGVTKKVESPAECAYICRQGKYINCRGFDFCQETMTCILSDVHTITSGIVDEKPKCKYYNLKYSSEFFEMGREVVTDENSQSFPITNLEDCSKICFEGRKCASINFCVASADDEPASCQLNSKSVFDDVKTIVKENCKHYVKRSDNRTVTPEDRIFFPFKDLIKSEFEAHVDFLAKGDNNPAFRELSVEYHDLEKKKGRRDVYSGSTTATYFYNSDTFQVVSINDAGQCKASVDKDNDFFTKSIIWGWMENKNMIIGPSAVLFRETTELPTFVKQTTVRGIVCNQFEGKDSLDTNVNITYYLTASTWRPPTATQTRLPVRVTAKGTQNNNQPVESTWDFTYFKEDDYSDIIYQIPRGVGCENFKLKGSPEFPKIKRQFSYIEEFYYVTVGATSKDGKVLVSKIWYDIERKIVRMTRFAENTPFTDVQDFNSGINYRLDANGGCKIETISSTTDGKALNVLGRSMKDPLKFLNLDGDYYYIGKVNVRGIDCDVWESVKRNHIIEGITYAKSVYTYYFSDAMTETVSDGQKNLQVPVLLTVALSLPDVSKPEIYEYNFFDFDEAQDRDFYTELNIENCYPDENQRSNFIISIPVNEEKLQAAKNNSKLFHLIAGWEIEIAASVSPLRVPNLKVDFESQNIIISGVILERPPYIKGFYETKSKDYPPNKGEKELAVAFEDECAEQCIASQELKCTGFTTCPSGKSGHSCYLTGLTSGWQNVISTETCKFYLKSVENETIEDVPMDIAIANLKRSIENKNLIIPFLTTNSDDDLIAYIPDSIETDVKIGIPTDSERYRQVLKDFQLVSSSTSNLNMDVEGKVTSARDCYDRCLKEDNMACGSFSYCSASQQCRLSSRFVKSKDDPLAEQGTSCNVYNKEALKFFDEMKGQTAVSQGTKTITMTGSSEDCALACREETEFTCLGFDYCQVGSLCALSKKHFLDLPKSKNSSTCNHYSLRFSSEFDMKGRTLVWTDSRETFGGTTLEQCAKLCYDVDSFLCRSFNFCPGDEKDPSTCSITKATINDPGVKTSLAPTCGYYERISVPAATKETSSGVSNKSFTATLVSMLFVGIVVSILGFLGYSYYMKKRLAGDGISVRYTRSTD